MCFYYSPEMDFYGNMFGARCDGEAEVRWKASAT